MECKDDTLLILRLGGISAAEYYVGPQAHADMVEAVREFYDGQKLREETAEARGAFFLGGLPVAHWEAAFVMNVRNSIKKG